MGKYLKDVDWKTIPAERVNDLIKVGVDVNARNDRGWTPLMFAEFNENPAVIETLVKAGADVNIRDSLCGMTPLMLAALINHEAINVLIDAGADITEQDELGRTVLDYAEENPKIKGTEVYRKLKELQNE